MRQLLSLMRCLICLDLARRWNRLAGYMKRTRALFSRTFLKNLTQKWGRTTKAKTRSDKHGSEPEKVTRYVTVTVTLRVTLLVTQRREEKRRVIRRVLLIPQTNNLCSSGLPIPRRWVRANRSITGRRLSPQSGGW